VASFTDGTESALLKLLFNATAWANVADNAAGSPLTNLYVSLHNADPGEGGSQTTNETAYTNYARQAVARTSGGWTVSGTDPTQVVNAAIINFPQCGVTGDTLTHWESARSFRAPGCSLPQVPSVRLRVRIWNSPVRWHPRVQ